MQFGYTAAPAHFQHIMATAMESEQVEWIPESGGGVSVVEG